MVSHVRANLVLIGLTVAAGSVAYPLAVLGVGQAVFPANANGSLIERDGKVVGSRQIAQGFGGDAYLDPRPSAAGEKGYDAAASSGSNFAASNPKLRGRVEEQLKAEYAGVDSVPADLVTASGSGLDPHISLRGAKLQVGRIAAARRVTAGEVEGVIAGMATAPLIGEPLVNVLEANLELDRRFPK